jgi:hypothetical protein
MNSQYSIGGKGMRLRRKNSWFLVVYLSMSIIGLSCQKSETAAADQGSLSIKLTDAPGDLAQVNLVIDRVEIHRAGASGGVGWSYVSTSRVTADMLTLRNGKSVSMVSSKADPGNYDKVRIHYGPCTVTPVGGPEKPLTLDASIPSDSQIVAIDFTVDPRYGCNLGFDFDAYGSIKFVANKYILKPMIRAQNIDLCGIIAGSVIDTVQSPVASAISTPLGSDSAVTLNDVQSGSFQLVDLPEGYYSVHILPIDTTLQDTTIENVKVLKGNMTGIGVIPVHARR